jgi:hypothetical protein
MATTYVSPVWFRPTSHQLAPPLYVDDSSDLDFGAEDEWDARRGRRRLVRALGGVLVAWAVAALAWMVQATPARDAIVSWGTLGAASLPHLGVGPLDDDTAFREHDASAQATSIIAWALGPAPAERSRPGPVETRAKVAAPARSDRDDPYAAPQEARQTTIDPYTAVEIEAPPAAEAPYDPDGI